MYKWIKSVAGAVVLIAILVTSAPAPIIRIEEEPPPGHECPYLVSTDQSRQVPTDVATWLLLRIWVGPTCAVDGWAVWWLKMMYGDGDEPY